MCDYVEKAHAIFERDFKQLQNTINHYATPTPNRQRALHQLGLVYENAKAAIAEHKCETKTTI